MIKITLNIYYNLTIKMDITHKSQKTKKQDKKAKNIVINHKVVKEVVKEDDAEIILNMRTCISDLKLNMSNCISYLELDKQIKACNNDEVREDTSVFNINKRSDYNVHNIEDLEDFGQWIGETYKDINQLRNEIDDLKKQLELFKCNGYKDLYEEELLKNERQRKIIIETDKDKVIIEACNNWLSDKRSILTYDIGKELECILKNIKYAF
jgi:hypothetical protein